MFILSNITALLAGPSLAVSAFVMVQDNLEDARISYNNCLIEGHNDAMKASSNLKQFEVKSKQICTDERKAYYDIIFKDEKQFGASTKEAEEYAESETDNIREYIVSSYAVNLDGKLLMVKS